MGYFDDLAPPPPTGAAVPPQPDMPAPPPSTAKFGTFADLAPPVTTDHPTVMPVGDAVTDVPRFLGTAAKNAIAGAIALPHAGAQLVDYLGGKIGKDIGATKAIESVKAPFREGQAFPDYPNAQDFVYSRMGGREYKPQTLPGRLAMAGTEAAMTGGKNLLANFAGGAGGQLAAEYMPEYVNPVVGQLAGFALGSKLGAGAANTASRAVSSVTGAPMSDLYNAHTALDIPTDLTGNVTGKRPLQMAQAMARSAPGFEQTMRDAEHQALGKWRDALDTTAASLGKSATPMELGNVLKTAADQWNNDWRANSASYWNGVRGIVNPNTPVRGPATLKALADVRGDFGGARGLESALAPTSAGNIMSAMIDDTQNGRLTWQGLHAMRKSIGDTMGAPQAGTNDLTRGALAKIYSGITTDMRNIAQQHGGQAGVDLFDQANAYTRAGHQIIDDHLGPLLLRETTPEQATQHVLNNIKNGSSTLDAVVGNMPSTRGEIGGYALRNLSSSDTATASPTAFATKFSGKRPAMSQEAQQTLYGGNPEALDQIKNLALVGDAIKGTESANNHSGSAAHMSRGLGRVIGAREGAELGHYVGEHVGLGTLGGTVGAGLGAFAPELVGAPSRFMGLNPAVSRYYSVQPWMNFSQSSPASASGIGARVPLLTHNENP